MDSSLHERLERLHAELATIDAVDAEEREMLSRLMADIRNVLDAPAVAPPEVSALSRRLRAAVTRLETSYPNAALVMGQVVDALANLGL
jgi:hypothetical protein